MKKPAREKSNDSQISLRVSAEWLAALDSWREQQPVSPSRTAVIVAAVERFLASQTNRQKP
jgi:hypothetical protein